MNNSSSNTPDFLKDSAKVDNSLLQYVQSMNPETIAQLSRPVSTDVMQTMEHNIIGLLGGLPSQNFDITITTNREHLGRLLASAMMSGYFLRGAEQRLALESMISADSPSSTTALEDTATDEG
ncbi:MAG: DUF760 domain-containing protein [Leptolyngbya sp. RL_3_1]|nr:DUF760 domain-containing protein [Leptolyngbya sp. RL_3_1]